MSSKDVDAVSKVIVKRGDKALFLQKPNQEWELPGGHLMRGEKYSGGAKREVEEETGIKIKRLRVVLKSKNFVLFLATPKICSLSLSDEHIDAGWFTSKQAKKLNITKATKINWKNILRAI